MSFAHQEAEMSTKHLRILLRYPIVFTREILFRISRRIRLIEIEVEGSDLAARMTRALAERPNNWLETMKECADRVQSLRQEGGTLLSRMLFHQAVKYNVTTPSDTLGDGGFPDDVFGRLQREVSTARMSNRESWARLLTPFLPFIAAILVAILSARK
jgi:hypothetical protein